MNRGIFHRTELVFGKEKMKALSEKKVIIFGIGGVGSWCAESLVRTGISKLTIVDSDRICVTNINRQVQATYSNVGEVKTIALKKRLLDINPDADIVDFQMIYNQENHEFFNIGSYDYIIDAIDSLSYKVQLIKSALETKSKFFSSMGAALKVDPSRIKTGSIWDIHGCPFARMIRKRLRKWGVRDGNIQCVYSDEVLPNLNLQSNCGSDKCLCPKSFSGNGNEELENHEWCSMKKQINGSIAHITAIFGFTLAGMVIQDIYNSK